MPPKHTEIEIGRPPVESVRYGYGAELEKRLQFIRYGGGHADVSAREGNLMGTGSFNI